MTLEEFVKKEKIDKLYCYYEQRVSNSKIEYGWIEADIIDVTKPVIISYASRGKKISDDDKSWSNKEGRTASELKSYREYFSALTDLTPLEFIDVWENNYEALETSMIKGNPNYRESEGLFLLNVAKLIVESKKFSQFGRIYKVLDPVA